MRLSVNVITGSPSRYYKAGEEIPDEQVPAILRKAKYMLADPDPQPPPISPPLTHPRAEKAL